MKSEWDEDEISIIKKYLINGTKNIFIRHPNRQLWVHPTSEIAALALVQDTFPHISPANWEYHAQNLLCLNNSKREI